MINWEQIETVFLDMDGTLLDLHYDNYFWLTHLPKRYAEIKGLSDDAVSEKLQGMLTTYRGSLKWYCLEFWAQELSIDLMSLKYEVADKVGYRPNAKEFLSFVRERQLPVILVTNAHAGSVQIKFEHTDIEKYLDRVITSHSLKRPKEDPVFWQDLQRIQPYDPKKTLFIDDNEDVLASAKQAGFKHLYSIEQPDSGNVRQEVSEFPMIKDFADVLNG